MQPHNLFSLLADRLLLYPNGFTMATYNVLFEVRSFTWKIRLYYFIINRSL